MVIRSEPSNSRSPKTFWGSCLYLALPPGNFRMLSNHYSMPSHIFWFSFIHNFTEPREQKKKNAEIWSDNPPLIDEEEPETVGCQNMDWQVCMHSAAIWWEPFVQHFSNPKIYTNRSSNILQNFKHNWLNSFATTYQLIVVWKLKSGSQKVAIYFKTYVPEKCR